MLTRILLSLILQTRYTLVLCIVLIMPAFAVELNTSNLESTLYTYKNISDWHSQVDLLGEDVPEKYTSENDVIDEQLYYSLKHLQNIGESCEQYLLDNIDEITKELSILGESPDQDTSVVATARRSLNSEEIRHQRKLTSCKLLTVKTEKLLKKITSLSNKQARHQRMFKSYTVIDFIKETPNLHLLTASAKFFNTPKWNSENISFATWLIWLFLISLLAASKVYLHKKRFIFFQPLECDTITHRVAQSFMLNNHLLLFMLGLLFFSWVYFSAIELLVNQAFALTSLLGILSLTILFLCLINSIFSSHTNTIGLIRLPLKGLKVVRRHTRLLIIYLFLVYVQDIWPTPANINNVNTEALRFILLCAALYSCSNVCWHILSEFPLKYFRPFKYVTPPIAIIACLVLFSGFMNFIEFCVLSVVISYFILLSAYIGYRIASDLLDSLDEGRYRWQKHIKVLLDIDEKEIMPGLIWLRIFLVVFVYVLLGITLTNTWSAAHIDAQQLMEYASKGIVLGSLKIMPMQIIEAIIFIALSFPLLGWARRQFELRVLSKSRMDVGARDALSSILMYGLGILVLLIGLSMAGVDLSNIAIIAGALSLGIGFGLQTIVNNFVSGLILLLERPIKKGDWIIVDNTEGHVKQISVRSTLIQTFDHADMIVPNSDLITRVVKNWTFKSHTGRICIPISISYDSDINLAREILLDIANSRIELTHDINISSPHVLLLNFGDRAIDLELRFFVKTVKDSIRLASEVRFSILEKFKENNINIPYPHRILTVDETMQLNTHKSSIQKESKQEDTK